MNIGIIYCAISPSGKKYYGKTVQSLERRINNHKNSYKKRITYFYTAIKKYGIENFKWIIIEEIMDPNKIKLRKDLNERERYYIQKDQTHIKEHGYNMTLGGDGGAKFGRKLSEETKEKIRNSLIGKKHSEDRKKRMREGSLGVSRNKGRKLSDETKEKISKGKKGKKLSEETKKRMSESKRGKPIAHLLNKQPWNKGIPMSEEAKNKMIKNSLGVSRNKGRKLSEETKEKIRQSILNKGDK